jgi:hypothetical protein
MGRLKVVVTVGLALALALVLAGWRNSGDRAAEGKAAAKQKQLERAYSQGIAARASMDKVGQKATQAECEAQFSPARLLISATTAWSSWAASTSWPGA